MRRWKLVFFLSLFAAIVMAFVAPLHAELPSLIQENIQEEKVVPDPTRLKAGWWNYYEIAEEPWDAKVSKTREYFEEIRKILSEEQFQKTNHLLDKFLANLQALGELKSKQIKNPQPLPLFKTTYLFTEWLDLGKNLRENIEFLKSQKMKLDLGSSTLKSGNKYLETLSAAYLPKEKSPDLLLDGLEIMVLRSSLAIDEIRIKDLRTLIDEQERKIGHLKEEVQNAKNRINFDSAPLEEIENCLKQAKEQQVNLNLGLFLSIPAGEMTSALSQIQKDIAMTKLLLATMEQSFSELKIKNLEIETTLISFGKENLEASYETLRDKINQAVAEFKKVDREVANWKNSAELQLEEALTGLSRLSEAPSSERSLYLELLNLAEKTLFDLEKIETELFLSNYLLDELNFMIKEHFSTFTDRMKETSDTFFSFLKAHSKWFQQSFFKIGDVPITPIGMIKFIFIIACFIFLGKLVRRSLKKLSPSSYYAMGRLIYYFFFILGIIFGGSSLGFDFTALAYIAGIIALWIGFGLQGIFNNFICGIIVLLTKTIRIGDMIELENGVKGTVVDMTMRITVIRTPDGLDVIIPNADLISKKFVNWTLSGFSRRINIPFRVPLGTDKEVIQTAVIKAAKEVRYTVSTIEPQVWLTEFGDNCLRFELAVWVDEHIPDPPKMSSVSAYLWAIEEVLKKHQIEIPPSAKEVFVHLDKEKQIDSIGHPS